MLGEIAMYSMIICLVTGAFLTFWFVPSAGHTVYDGSFVPLRGVGMSEAYASTLNISFDIKGGLIIRQIHHWAALMFIVALRCTCSGSSVGRAFGSTSGRSRVQDPSRSTFSSSIILTFFAFLLCAHKSNAGFGTWRDSNGTTLPQAG